MYARFVIVKKCSFIWANLWSIADNKDKTSSDIFTLNTETYNAVTV